VPRKQPEKIFRVFRCWNCQEFHEFERSSYHMSKLKTEHKEYKNQLWGWACFPSMGMCTNGGAYMEEFMPDEELIRNGRERGSR